jgi:hypothetical protein
MDIFEVSEGGTVKRTKDDKIDQIVVVKDNGTKVEGKQYEVVDGKHSITLDFSKTVKQKDGNEIDVSFLKITGDDKAKESFELVANNTNVEWSWTQTGSKEGADGSNYLSSSQERGHENSFGVLSGLNYTIRGHTHNHPSLNPWPSNADMKTAGNYSFPLNTYVKGGGYFPYNSAGIIDVKDRERAAGFEISNWKYK